MATLVLAEHDNFQLNPATHRAMTAALALGRPVDVLVAGAGCRAVADQAARMAGVRTVLLAEDESLRHAIAEAASTVIVSVSAPYATILAPATTSGKNILPRVAALLDVMQISDVTAVRNSKTFEHPIYAGNAIEVVRSTDAKTVLTIRTSSFDAVPENGRASIVQVEAETAPVGTLFVSENMSLSDRPDLTGARVVISGGRGLGSREGFETMLNPLADLLSAALGASRAAVDAGFAPSDWQVGQTGKVVAPEVYIAVGISGAVQHLAGMKDAKIVVAINKDADAPIFSIADYGLVGDLFSLVPQLTRELSSKTSAQ